MSSEAFWKQEKVAAMLERAALAAVTPLSIHVLSHEDIEAHVTGWGGCEVCAFVSRVEGGKQACREARSAAARMALRQQRALAFTCHMGLACVATPALPGENHVLTFGPFCPAGDTQALSDDIARGLRALGAGHVIPPLTGLHNTPPATVVAIAEWARETLETLHREVEADTRPSPEEALEETGPPSSRGRGSVRETVAAPYAGAAIAAAAAGGNQPQVRDLLRNVLEEGSKRTRTRIEERRARMTAAVAASLEKLARTGHSGSGWKRFGAFLEALRVAEDDAGLLDAALLVLGAVRREAKPRATGKHLAPVGRVGASYPRLNEILTQRLDAPLTLDEVARELGETPSAISHRLKKKFGMSFSEYRGRLRIGKAKELLRRTRLSATDVARRVGIADQSNFGKLFKKFEGMSPLEYRKRHGRD